MTAAEMAPVRAPERMSPHPMMNAATSVTPIAASVATAGGRLTSASPSGASGMIWAFRSGEMARTANAYPAIAPNPMWPNDMTPVLPT